MSGASKGVVVGARLCVCVRACYFALFGGVLVPFSLSAHFDEFPLFFFFIRSIKCH